MAPGATHRLVSIAKPTSIGWRVCLGTAPRPLWRERMVIVAALLATALPGAAHADLQITVNSPSDVVDANPGDGVCGTAAGNGVCTCVLPSWKLPILRVAASASRCPRLRSTIRSPSRHPARTTKEAAT